MRYRTTFTMRCLISPATLIMQVEVFCIVFLADVNHQPIARNLTEKEYACCVKLMDHVGVKPNTYAQYKVWGTICNPWRALTAIVLNWSFWFTAFFLIGGFPLACAIFAAAGFWGVGVRTFNYEGHGKGKDKRRDGIDHNREDMSVNQIWPGIVAGEWHNNHHLFPNSARSGFKAYQVDTAWYYIKFMSMIGAVSSYRDSKAQFMEEYVNVPVAVKLVPVPLAVDPALLEEAVLIAD